VQKPTPETCASIVSPVLPGFDFLFCYHTIIFSLCQYKVTIQP